LQTCQVKVPKVDGEKVCVLQVRCRGVLGTWQTKGLSQSFSGPSKEDPSGGVPFKGVSTKAADEEGEWFLGCVRLVGWALGSKNMEKSNSEVAKEAQMFLGNLFYAVMFWCYDAGAERPPRNWMSQTTTSFEMHRFIRLPNNKLEEKKKKKASRSTRLNE